MTRAKPDLSERRRFPPPWTVSDTGTSWKVEDAAGFAMVWFCYEPERITGTWPERLTRDEARRLAAGFAKLPGLLAPSGSGA